MASYYNENCPKPAAWIRELIKSRLIPYGIVDERSICDVQPNDLSGFTQCHFFAGIAGWPLALRLAGWPEGKPVGSGSCPCQPFSAAGSRLGAADARHLWPVLFKLICQCRALGQPWAFTVFGEQVASSEVVGTELEASFIVAVQAGDFGKANKLAKRLAQSSSFHYHKRWLSGIRSDLESEGYTLRSCVLGAHSVGAPHIRQRLYWVANSISNDELKRQEDFGRAEFVRGSASGRLADSQSERRDRIEGATEPERRSITEASGRMVDSDDAGSQGRRRGLECQHGQEGREDSERHDIAPGFWDSFDIVHCSDGKSRRIESKSSPLVAGLPRGVVPSGDPSIEEAKNSAEGRIARLSGYGNSINSELAAQFIRSSIEVINETQQL